MDLAVSNPGGGGNNNSNSSNMLREYRKGNWTLQETMVLIEAKKMDDQRRMKRLGDSGERGKPAELRWKWVEDYCWKNGCLRSQNQCNDKWDNLMRDFKKVKEYEKRAAEGRIGEDKSYWRIDKNERKDNNLPSNMLLQIYEALVEVVERKGQWVAGGGSGGAGSSGVSLTPSVGEKSEVKVLPRPLQPIPIMQYPVVTHPLLMLPPMQTQTQAQAQAQAHTQATPAEPSSVIPPRQASPAAVDVSDSDTSGEEYTDSVAKRRKRGGSGEGTSGGGAAGGGGGGGDEVGSAISRSGAIIAEAIQSCEEREERRHRELLGVQQRRLQIEESKAEINRQGINGLVDAINNLANSILALANQQHKSHSHNSPSPSPSPSPSTSPSPSPTSPS